VKRLLYLTTVALVALLLFVPTVMAQEMEAEVKVEETRVVEQKVEGYAPLPPSGGPAASSVLLPAAALLVGSGILAYAILRRR
jgi:hypothetical protein